MAVLTEAIRAALRANAPRWLGSLDALGRSAFESALQRLPPDVADAVLACMVDPEAHLWACGALVALDRAGALASDSTPDSDGQAPRVIGMATDELIEAEDPEGLRFGIAPIATRQPAQPLGDPDGVRRLLDALDRMFAEQAYVLHVVKPIPAEIDAESVAKAVWLWLSEVGAKRRRPRGEPSVHAKYEDGGVSIDFTLAPQAAGRGRLLTLGPFDAIERIQAIERGLIDTLATLEHSVGELPLVPVLVTDQPWNLPRGYVQLHLYGPPLAVTATHAGSESAHETWFGPHPSAMFRAERFAEVAGLWWVGPAPEGAAPPPFPGAVHVLDNPWARQAPAVDPAVARLRCVQVEPDGAALMRWSR